MDTSRFRRLGNGYAIGALLLLSGSTFRAEAATYYVDYANGSDSNPGTSITAPWKHCPAMKPFNGSYSHQSGDRFVFKGGVTWPNAALPLRVTLGGAPGNRDFYGVDRTWFTGTSWSRPVLDAQATEFTHHEGNRGNVIWIEGASDVVVEGLEIKHYVWTNPAPTSISDGFCVYVSSSDRVEVREVFCHDWVVRTTADGKFGGIGAYGGSELVVSGCRVVAPATVDPQYVTDLDGGSTSGCGVIGFGTVEESEFVGTTQGIWGGQIVRNNRVHDGQDSFNKDEHENGVWIQNDADFYGNTIFNVREGVGAFFLPGWGYRSGKRLNVFNNVFYDLPQINLAPDQNPVGSANELWFFNNTVMRATYCLKVGSEKTGAPFGRLVIENNVFVSEHKYAAPSSVVYVLDPNDLGTNHLNDHNAVFTEAEASAAGMTRATLFAPSTPIAELFDKGVAIGAPGEEDRLGISRPQGAAWDIGPYELCAAGPCGQSADAGVPPIDGSSGGPTAADGGPGEQDAATVLPALDAAFVSATDASVATSSEGGCGCSVDATTSLFALLALAGFRRTGNTISTPPRG